MINSDAQFPSIKERFERPNPTVNQLSVEFLEDFGGNWVTENMRLAHEQYTSVKSSALTDTLNLRDIADFRKTFENQGDFDQTMGILLDTKKIDKTWQTYTQRHLISVAIDNSVVDVPLYNLLGEERKISENSPTEILENGAAETLWRQPMEMLDVPELLKLAEKVNLETVYIESVHALAQLESIPYRSYEAYQLSSKIEAILAPLCEIIGFDGLAMALRSRVACIELRNTGQGEYVDLAEQILSEYAGDTKENGTLCYDKLQQNVQDITEQVVGPNNHELVVGTSSRHGIIFGDGSCETDDIELRKIWRLKSVGSLARKLARQAKDKRKKMLEPLADQPFNDGLRQALETHEDRSIDIPMDIAGVTLVAATRDELADSYATAFRNLQPKLHQPSLDDTVYPYQAFSRDKAFYVEGDDDFINIVRQRLTDEFDDDIARFVKFKCDTKKGFRVAKITGYHSGDTSILPFEIQFITQEDRHNARVGKAAHIFYKLSRQLGRRYDPTKEELEKLENINGRKEHFGSDGLCHISQLGINLLNRRLDSYEQHVAAIGKVAIKQ